MLQCDPLHANSYALAINTIEEHQFLVDNVPANQGLCKNVCVFAIFLHGNSPFIMLLSQEPFIATFPINTVEQVLYIYYHKYISCY